MPVCSTGISGPRAGVVTSIVVDAAYIQSILPTTLAWLYPYLPFMHGLQIGDVPTFCSVDPPTWTVPSGADIYAFVSGGPIGQAQTVNQFMQDITRAYLWYNLCECKSVATPARPTAPSAPSDLPAINPPGVVSSPATPCETSSGSRNPAVSQNIEVISGVLYGSGAQPAESAVTLPIPAGARQLRVTSSWAIPTTAFTGTQPNALALVGFYSGTSFVSTSGYGTIASGDASVGPPYVLRTGIVNIPSTADRYVYNARIDDATGRSVISGTIEWFCDQGPNVGGAQGCCTATDPVTTATLTQILQMVTLLQRQTAPFAYVSGPVHSGLTGTGSFAVQGILGLHASASGISGIGLRVGTPDVRIEIGRLNLGTSDAFSDRVQLVLGDQVVFPAAAGLFTVVGYTLEPGVTLTVTELLREP